MTYMFMFFTGALKRIVSILVLFFACKILRWKLCVVSFAIECDVGQVPIYIKRIFKANAFEETFQIWEGEAKAGTLMYEKNGLNFSSTEQYYEVCLNKALHTLVLLDAYVTLFDIDV